MKLHDLEEERDKIAKEMGERMVILEEKLAQVTGLSSKKINKIINQEEYRTRFLEIRK